MLGRLYTSIRGNISPLSPDPSSQLEPEHLRSVCRPKQMVGCLTLVMEEGKGRGGEEKGEILNSIFQFHISSVHSANICKLSLPGKETSRNL